MIARKLRPATLTPDDDPAAVTIDDFSAVAAAAEALVLVAYQAIQM